MAQRPSLTSRNIDAFSSRPVARSKLILDHIIFLQEATPDVRAALLDDARVRAAFLVTDAEDQTSFEGVSFATMTLLSSARFASGTESQKEGDGIGAGGRFMLGSVSRVTLPSKYKRDGLYVEILPPTAPPGTVFRLVNVHLDSLGDRLPFRPQQMKMLADVCASPDAVVGSLQATLTPSPRG